MTPFVMNADRFDACHARHRRGAPRSVAAVTVVLSDVDGVADITGVEVSPVQAGRDERGRVVELWRRSISPEAEQWNIGVNEAGALRGVHWHSRTTDRLVLASGRILVAVIDQRRGSPSEGVGRLAWWAEDQAVSISIPPGVLHGWWSPERSVHVYSMDVEWAPGEVLGVRWDDPDLGVPWPREVFDGPPILSAADATLPFMADAVLPAYTDATSSAVRTAANA